MSVTCSHLDSIHELPPGLDVCEECVAAGEHEWATLRQCLECGGTRCCDNSPNTHATKHHQASGHPIVRSAMPGEDWMWCYVCEQTFRRADGGFAPVDAFFEAGLHFMKQRIRESGSAQVEPTARTAQGFPLGAWSETYRAKGREGALDPTQREALEALPGWDW